MKTNRLLQARKRAGLSLREAATLVGISHEAISKFEKGKLKLDSHKLIQFANAYKTTVDSLILKDKEPVELGEIIWFRVSADGMRIKHYK